MRTSNIRKALLVAAALALCPAFAFAQTGSAVPAAAATTQAAATSTPAKTAATTKLSTKGGKTVKVASIAKHHRHHGSLASAKVTSKVKTKTATVETAGGAMKSKPAK